jgi:hypothetical protein
MRLELSTSAAVRAAVLAGSAPALLSRLAVSDDIAMGRLQVVPVSELDLRRDLRAIWLGGRTPPAGAVRDLLGHIGSITDGGKSPAAPGRALSHEPSQRDARLGHGPPGRGENG